MKPPDGPLVDPVSPDCCSPAPDGCTFDDDEYVYCYNHGQDYYNFQGHYSV
eukprot:UN06116